RPAATGCERRPASAGTASGPATGAGSQGPSSRRGGHAVALLQHRDHRDRRLGALVTIALGGAEAVAAAARALIEQRNPGIVVAQEPRHAHLHADEPVAVAGDG